jgi:hypothetical protein
LPNLQLLKVIDGAKAINVKKKKKNQILSAQKSTHVDRVNYILLMKKKKKKKNSNYSNTTYPNLQPKGNKILLRMEIKQNKKKYIYNNYRNTL